MKGSSRFAVLAALALGAAGVAATPGQTTVPKAAVASPISRYEAARRQGLAFASASSYRKRGPGLTFAHVKRMARKRRNVLRNRRAHRG